MGIPTKIIYTRLTIARRGKETKRQRVESVLDTPHREPVDSEIVEAVEIGDPGVKVAVPSVDRITRVRQ